jgi:hypothetical protein
MIQLRMAGSIGADAAITDGAGKHSEPSQSQARQQLSQRKSQEGDRKCEREEGAFILLANPTHIAADKDVSAFIRSEMCFFSDFWAGVPKAFGYFGTANSTSFISSVPPHLFAKPANAR